MLSTIKDRINQQKVLLEEAGVIAEDVMGNLDDMIVLGESGENDGLDDSNGSDPAPNDPDIGTDGGNDPGSSENNDLGLDEGSEEPSVDAPVPPAEDDSSDGMDLLNSTIGGSSPSELGGDDLPTPIGAQTGEPAQLDSSDLLNMEINLTSNTPTDILPIPPAGAIDAIPGNEDEVNPTQKVDSGFGGNEDTVVPPADPTSDVVPPTPVPTEPDSTPSIPEDDDTIAESTELVDLVDAITESYVTTITTGDIDDEVFAESTAATKYIHKLRNEIKTLHDKSSEIRKLRNKYPKDSEGYKLCDEALDKLVEKRSEIREKAEKLGESIPSKMDSLESGRHAAKEKAKGLDTFADDNISKGKEKKSRINVFKTDKPTAEDLKELKSKLKKITESAVEANEEISSMLEAITIDGGDNNGDNSGSEEPAPDASMSEGDGENGVTSAVRDKVNEAEGNTEDVPMDEPLPDEGIDDGAIGGSDSKEDILKKLNNLTKSLEDAKNAVIQKL